MNIRHHHWYGNGRIFEFLDDLGQVVPNKFVEKKYTGQKNVLVNGQYYPYHWDKEKKVLQYGTCEIRLTDSQVEFWQKDTKLLGASIHPEVEEALAWNRKESTVSGLRITEHLTERARDFITVAYDVVTEDQKATIEIKVGGSNWARSAFIIEAKQTGKQRLTIAYDRKGTPIQDYDRGGKPLPIRRYNFGKGIWSWLPGEQDDHALEQLASISELRLKEGDYEATKIKKVSFDSFGPSETSDDCTEIYDYGLYFDEYEGHVDVGNMDGSNRAHMGLIFSNIQAYGTAEDGCKISVYVEDVGGSGPTAILKISDEDNPTAWSSSHLPSDCSFHATTATWNEGSSGWQDSPEIKGLLQHRFDDPTWDTYRKAALGWMDNNSSSGNYLYITSEESGDGAEITIVYSTGGATIELAGIISAVASLTGGLALALPLAGTISGQAGVDGLLKPIRELLGQIDSQTTVEGTLKPTLGVTGEISAQSAVEGILKPLIGLIGQVTGETTANGILSRILALAGDISALAGVTGDLSVAGQVVLAGTIDALSTVQAALSATKPLQGTIDAQATAQGILGLVRGIAGAIDAQSTAQATLTHYLGLIGAIAGQASIDGDLTVEASYILLAGVVEALSSTEGAIQMDWSLAGEIGASAEVQGLLGLAREMAGTIEGQAALIAALTVALLAALETIELESTITKAAEHGSAILLNTEMGSEILRSVELISRLNSQNN